MPRRRRTRPARSNQRAAERIDDLFEFVVRSARTDDALDELDDCDDSETDGVAVLCHELQRACDMADAFDVAHHAHQREWRGATPMYRRRGDRASFPRKFAVAGERRRCDVVPLAIVRKAQRHAHHMAMYVECAGDACDDDVAAATKSGVLRRSRRSPSSALELFGAYSHIASRSAHHCYFDAYYGHRSSRAHAHFSRDCAAARREQAELRRALDESRRDAASGNAALTPAQMLQMLTRELTPEDYELLLALDESVARKTFTAHELRAGLGSAVFTLDAVRDAALLATLNGRDADDAADDDNGGGGGDDDDDDDDDEHGKRRAPHCAHATTCGVCLDTFAAGDELARLPCGHHFHYECVQQWLTTRSRQCPVDNVEVRFKATHVDSPVASGSAVVAATLTIPLVGGGEQRSCGTAHMSSMASTPRALLVQSQ